MSKVVVRNGNIDGALRTFKQKNLRDGSYKKLRSIQDGYMKPGEKRRAAKKEGTKNSRNREKLSNRAA